MADSSSPISPISPIIEIEADDSSSSKRRSIVYQYFTYKSSRWYCNHCKKSFTDKATSTLWRHMKTNHPKIGEVETPEKEGAMDQYINTGRKENVSLIFNLR